MKRRAALVVGCNDYSHLNPLFGACSDAEKFYQALISESIGAYDADSSVLLLSPVLEEFRRALERVLFRSSGADVFTLFFAGHGGVKGGSYYLCFQDTNAERMSTTAQPLNALFTVLNESCPAQTNIIIDACNAGGLVGDLSTLLKPEVLGASGSPSISLLAAASADEYAKETADGGVVTSLILEYLTGTRRVNTTSPYLELSDIGRLISQEINTEHGQTPTWWGLNLYGQSRFVKNAFYSSSPSPLDNLPGIVPTSAVGKRIGAYADKIWDEYRALAEEPSAFRLAKTLRPVIADLSDDPDAVAAFVHGLARTLEPQAARSADAFGPLVVASVLLTLLTPFVQYDVTRAAITQLLQRRRQLVLEASSWLKRRQTEDQYYLLGRHGSADLFLLPIRITGALGYLWSQLLLDDIDGIQDTAFATDLVALTKTIYSFYAGSFVSVSDEQAPSLYLFARAATVANQRSLTKEILNRYFVDLLRRKGCIADAHIDAAEILQFLVLRERGAEREAPQLLANPSQLVAVMLARGLDLELDVEWDKQLRNLDHSAFVLYLPRSYGEFGLETMRDGVNNCFQIGHGVWTLADFRQEFRAECLPSLQADSSWRDSQVRALGIISSLVYPDRIPWFLEVGEAPASASMNDKS